MSTVNAEALRPFLSSFSYPVPIYREKGDEIDDYATESRLRQYIRDGLVTGQMKGKTRVKRIRFVLSLRETMAKVRMVKPADAAHIPIVGDVLMAYMNNTRRSRSLKPRMTSCLTLMQDGMVLSERITPVEL